jgi:hypothetical protein
MVIGFDRVRSAAAIFVLGEYLRRFALISRGPRVLRGVDFIEIAIFRVRIYQLEFISNGGAERLYDMNFRDLATGAQGVSDCSCDQLAARSFTAGTSASPTRLRPPRFAA